MNKVAILGIDGASPKLIEQWRDELPNLKRIMEGGVYGELESTIPPVTCPAWPCMFTGKNPGKIGMYGFISVDVNDDYHIKISSSQNYQQWSLWKMLNDAGIPVGILNLAMTFPPHKVDGFVVCGIGAPASGRSEYTYPSWLKHELEKAVPGYEPFTPADMTIPGKEAEYSKILEREVDNRCKAAKYLMDPFSWELFVSVFFAVDSAQHYFWKHMDDSHPGHKGEKYKDVIKHLYMKVDCAIGELINKLPEKTNIIVVSDHGFQTCHRDFVVNRWLEKQGLLTLLPQAKHSSGSSLLWRIRGSLLSTLNPWMVKFIASILPEWLMMKLSTRKKEGYLIAQFYRSIDWSKTLAYCQGGTGAIRINLKGREPAGIVEPGKDYEKLLDKIICKLREINDPESGEKINISVFEGREIYSGEYADEGPDIVFYFDKYMPVGGGRDESSEWRTPSRSGWHARNGTFMAYGPDVKSTSEKLENLKIYDITPTLLHMFGLPVPDDMDGRVLTEILRPDSEPAKRKVIIKPTGEKYKTKGKISKLKESRKI
ncbi:MAG: alkaline phosphatase family protein [Dehalococcoidia bacterium]|nr:alkaline phosphatase family protein [Dehalococcoidia bacterium]